jgi:hypothetical protein
VATHTASAARDRLVVSQRDPPDSYSELEFDAEEFNQAESTVSVEGKTTRIGYTTVQEDKFASMLQIVRSTRSGTCCGRVRRSPCELKDTRTMPAQTQRTKRFPNSERRQFARRWERAESKRRD